MTYGQPAAFRRLCVETLSLSGIHPKRLPAAFRRLCVETLMQFFNWKAKAPAAFRRLCVETTRSGYYRSPALSSRLQAAVC